jgi:hypothetical protein
MLPAFHGISRPDRTAFVLLRSVNRGDRWQEMSPDLTTNAREQRKGNIQFCTLTTISESRLTPGVIWVGTDDGKVQVARDGGGAIAALEGKGAAGLNLVVWDFRRTGAQQPSQSAGAQAQAGQGPRAQALLAPPGEYVVVPEIGDKTWRTRATVRAAPERD